MHTCTHALITCEDFRLHQRGDGRNYVANFIESLGGECDLITRGGAIQDLVRPQSEGYKNALIRDLTVSVKKHDVEKIILLNHEDCGAYEAMDFKAREQELDQHTADLHTAKEVIEKEFPGVEVLLYFGYLKEGSADEFEIKPLKT
ncbi:MAG: hypothetical protein H8D63_00070 [Parcubacteria group bacterium]|nr:hypothetical protein [Parcubacteria group bacterium]